jgi:diguanylate cyclase (GGDEF)-like protein
MFARAGGSSFRSLIAVAAGLTCAATLAIGATLWWLRDDAMDTASQHAGNLAAVLAAQINDSINLIDLVLTEIRQHEEGVSARAADDFDRVLRDEATNEFLKAQSARLTQSEFVGLMDRQGNLLNTTRQWPPPTVNVSDRAYFQYFESHDDKGVFISNLLNDRIKGLRVILFSKRINGPNNEFLGVAIIGVRVTYFQHIYKSIASLPGQRFLLLQRDGTVIVRYPDSKARGGEKLPAESPWHRLILRGGGDYESHGYFDGKVHLVAVRPLANYPLVVNVGVAKDAALATWNIQAIAIGAGTLLVILCLALLLKALNRQFNLLAGSEATLARANATVDVALNNMSQGLIMFDSANRMVVCNLRYLEMYGLSPEIIRPGCTLREILEHRIAVGCFFAEDHEQYLAEILATLERGATFSKLTCLPDGRIVSIVNRPVTSGGWVATHEDVTEAKRAEERISYAAHHDSLTGLPNRKLFSEQLEQALKRVRRGERLAVLYLDVDHLKRINDTLGHPVGDQLLKGVAERLRGCVREIDLVARLSGDEFAIIHTSLERPADAADLAMRAREAIHEPFDFDGHAITVDVSVGISIAPNDASELNDLLKTADIALYEAKNSGRGTFCFYEPDMNARMQTRDKLERDLQSALANGEFELFYQPVVDVKENKIMCCEALLRWHHPTRGLISPAEFIPIAEETGLIVPLGEWVLRTACAEAANWPDDIEVAVNVSSVQMTNKNLANVVVGAIASAGIKPDRLVLEITETVFMRNTFANLATLNRLHELGVRLSMDDFGTGYSSLSYLMSFPFSKIKIDRSFITDLAEKKESRAIVRAIADLARSLKMRVIAEGVETAQQLEQLRRLGCMEIQGYLFSPPRPAAEIRQFFAAPGKAGAVTLASRVA